MNHETYKFISRFAEQVISEYRLALPITDMKQVVEMLGGTLEELDDHDEFLDGCIRKTGDSGFSVAVSSMQSDSMKKFAAAGALGHLFLHMGYRTDPDLWNSLDPSAEYMSFRKDEQIMQANAFAEALLMPEQEYTDLVDSLAVDNTVNIQQVAEHFAVSAAAAKKRGTDLHLLQMISEESPPL